MNELEAKVESLEKEVAELKRQLGERPTKEEVEKQTREFLKKLTWNDL